MKPPFNVATRAGSAMIDKIALARYEKLMSMSAFARRNYLLKKEWTENGRDIIDNGGKKLIRIRWSKKGVADNVPQTWALRLQIRIDIEEEGLIYRNPFFFGRI